MNKSQEAGQVQESSNKQNKPPSPNKPSLSIPKEISINNNNSIKLTLAGAVQLNSPKSKKDIAYHDKRKWDDSFTIEEKSDFTGNIVKAARDIDGETYVTLQEEEFTKTSEKPDEDSHESDDSECDRKPGRKPMADEEAISDSDQDPKVKRKAQNRAAQRAFRERKERYVKELEAKIKQVQDSHLVATSQLIRENHQLRSVIYRLEAENFALKGIQIQYPPVQMQTQTTQPPPISVQQQPSASGGNNSSNTRGNYPAIAPLLPSPSPFQTPFILPAYPYSTSAAANLTSSIDSGMMVIPSSPVPINTSSPSPTLTSSSTSSKKSNIKARENTPPPPSTSSNNQQPLEYTFSISTPASLKSSGGTVSNQYKSTRTEPIELVQLYPPGGNRQTQNNRSTRNASESPSAQSIPDTLLLLSPKSNHSSSINQAQSVVSSNGSVIDDEISEKSGHSISTQQKKMTQLENDMFDCHIDVEGQIFCERLHNEVCNDAFDRLLSEPLFDQMGKLNLSIGNYPVPIVTGPLVSLKDDEKHDEPKRKRQTPPNEKGGDLLTVSEIWFALSSHSKFKDFSTDQLCQAVKDLAKCADGGPVLEKEDLYEIFQSMDKGTL